MSTSFLFIHKPVTNDSKNTQEASQEKQLGPGCASFACTARGCVSHCPTRKQKYDDSAIDGELEPLHETLRPKVK